MGILSLLVPKLRFEFSKGGDSPPAAPAPPDPSVSIEAQAKANRYNVLSPFGSTTWSQGGTTPMSYQSWMKQTYPGGVPKPAAPLPSNMGGGGYWGGVTGASPNWITGQQGANFIGSEGTPSQPIDPNKQYQDYVNSVNTANASGSWTQTQTLNPSQQKQFGVRNQIAEQMLGRGQTQFSALPSSPFSFNEATPDAAKAIYQKQVDLMQPDIKMADQRFEQKMSNAGLPVGSDAYNEALRQHEQDKNFALNQASQQATTTGAQMSLQQRQQNYNELAALLGGQQLQPLNTSAAPLDVTGAYAAQQAGTNLGYQGSLAAFNAQQAQRNSLQGGLFGLGGAALMGGLMAPAGTFSDRRLKRNIKRVGTLSGSYPLYEFDYIWGEHAMGVMADEVETMNPMAVFTHSSGFKMVNYAAL